jgi:sugar phosphate isomerase/epimerase
MHLGIFARTFPGTDPDTVLLAAAQAGFGVVHYNMSCSGLSPALESVPPAVADEVADAANRHEMEICGVSATYNVIHPDPEVRRHGMARFSGIAEVAPIIGTDLLTICTGTRDPDDMWRAHPDNAASEAWRDLLTAMEQMIRVADEHDVRIGVEPELGNVVSSAATARRLLDELQSDRIRIVLDAANLFEAGSCDDQHGVVSEAIELLADRIVVAHAKDRARDGSPCAPGRGIIDFDHYVHELTRAGFCGPLVAHGLPAEDAPATARFLRERIVDRDRS